MKILGQFSAKINSLSYIVLAGYAIPMFVAQAMTELARGGPDDSDDDGNYLDEWLKVFFESQFKGAMAMIPAGGQFGSAGWDIYAEGHVQAGSRIGSSPVTSAAETAINLPKTWARVLEGEGDEKKAVRDTATILGAFTALPLGGAARPVSYGAGVASGDIQPTDEIDLARGLITGAPSEASKTEN